MAGSLFFAARIIFTRRSYALPKGGEAVARLRGAAALTAALLLGGCSGASVENLLTAPKLTQEQSEIYQALINSTGNSVNLKYPRGGGFRSAFVLQNIDDEPGEEALVFYESQSVQSGESALRMKVLDKYDGQWQAVYDLACVGSEVDSISFAKLGDGKCTEVIVCCSMLNQTEKTLSVLNYSSGIITELYNGSYACMEVMDLNSDGQDELITVVPDKTTQVAMAMMFTKNDDGARFHPRFADCTTIRRAFGFDFEEHVSRPDIPSADVSSHHRLHPGGRPNPPVGPSFRHGLCDPHVARSPLPSRRTRHQNPRYRPHGDSTADYEDTHLPAPRSSSRILRSIHRISPEGPDPPLSSFFFRSYIPSSFDRALRHHFTSSRPGE
mgnify:CR=1 FL=1